MLCQTFLKKSAEKNFEQLQIFIEPKGGHLLEKDSWKEKFLLRLENEAVPVIKFADDGEYKIFGLHFYDGDDERIFDADFEKLIEVNDENFD